MIPAVVVVGVDPDWELFVAAVVVGVVAVGQPKLVEQPDWPKGQRQTLAWGRVHNESSIRRWEVLRVEARPHPHDFDDFGGYPPYWRPWWWLWAGLLA